MVAGLDWHIISKALRKNVDRDTEKAVKIREKKLTNLTKNTNNIFTHNYIITNLPLYNLITEELHILKQGLQTFNSTKLFK